MLNKFRFISVALLALMLSAFAFGQGTTGEIEGTITDSTGAVVPGATVKIESAGSTVGFNRTVTVDSNGYFIVSNLQPGAYKVTVNSSGFDSYTKTVTVVVDKSASVNASLVPAGTTAQVDVDTSGAVTIDTSDTKIDTNITKDIIDALPKGTTFGSLLKIAPNVRPEGRAGGFQIDGASGSENVFVIDGQEVTNFRTGSLDTNFNLPFELLQEVQIKSTGFEAEYGGATGGVINAVTAGGNDQWRGNFGISFRPSGLQGDFNPILNRYLTNNDPSGFEQWQPPKDGGTDMFPVASISGPIIKSKVWFSATYAPQIFETNRTIDYFGTSNPTINRTPLQTVTYNQKVRQEDAFFRLDAQPHSRFRLFGTFLWNPQIVDGLVPGTTEAFSAPQSVNFGGSIGTLSGAELLSKQGGRQNANSFNGQATWTALDNLVLNFRGGRSFLNEKSASYFVPRVTRYICSQVAGFLQDGTPITSAQTGCAQGFQNVGNNNSVIFDVSTRTTFDADGSVVGVNAGGRHNFKFGFQYNRLSNDVERGYTDLGIIQLFYGRAINTLGVPNSPSAPLCTATPTAGCVLGSGLMTRFGTVGSASSANKGLYAQDSYQIASRLTLNLGVRIENEVVPSFGDSSSTQAIEFGWGDKVAPRFGAAYDVMGDGKTKIFGSYGWFYDRFKYELPRGSFGGDFFRRDFFEILQSRGVNYTSYTLNNILGGAPDPIGGTCPIVNGPGYSVCQFDFRIATNSIGADIFETGAVDPNLEAARQSEYTFGVERELGNNLVVKGRYTHKQVDRAIEDVGVFNDQGSEAYIIGNPGYGLVCEVSDLSGYPCPKAERKYDAVEVQIDKRAAKYFFSANYTWSRLFGNYSGLASSDEAGRTSPNVNRFFDLPPLGFNANGEPDNGLLSTDRTHVFKAYGGYTFDWGSNGVNSTSVTAFTTIQSGTPQTTIYNLYSLGTTILNERGDLGRTESFTETDLAISHRYKFGRDNRLTFEPYIDFRNLFDERNILGSQTTISTTNFVASTLTTGGCTTCGSELAVFDTLFLGGGIRQYVNNYLSTIDASANRTNGTRNDYGQPNSYQAGRDVRFGFRFFF